MRALEEKSSRTPLFIYVALMWVLAVVMGYLDVMYYMYIEWNVDITRVCSSSGALAVVFTGLNYSS